MSFALPGLSDEFGYSKTLLGLLGTALFIMYSLGQFVNGQLGDKYGARKLVFVGMIGSALLNIIFSFSTAFGFMLVVWGLNGYFQSMGWSPQVKTMANWFTVAQRGKWMGLHGLLLPDRKRPRLAVGLLSGGELQLAHPFLGAGHPVPHLLRPLRDPPAQRTGGGRASAHRTAPEDRRGRSPRA